MEIIETYKQKGDLDKAIEIAENGKELSNAIEEILRELIHKREEEKRRHMLEKGAELLE
ncbi:MAG: hypothetical protein HFG73_03165 [Hungatella sp.]|nr:hypothetical protein [Hungatella sp.]